MPFLVRSKSAGAPQGAEHWCRKVGGRLLSIGLNLCISAVPVAAARGFGLHRGTKLPRDRTVTDTYLVGYLLGGLLMSEIGVSTIEAGWRFRKAWKADAKDSERLVAALGALGGTLGWLIPFCAAPPSVVFFLSVVFIIRSLQ